MDIWPVIHVETPPQVIENAIIARNCNCAGVMLIAMRGSDHDVDAAAMDIRRVVPGLKIGVNYLRESIVPRALIFSQKQNYDATWTDHQLFTRGEMSPMARDIISVIRPGHLFFAAVAFKGQEPDPFPGGSARLAAYHGLIPTTSGEATGVAPPVEKLERIRRELEPADRMALASGATPDNIGAMAPFLTHVLVATGITSKFEIFDERRLRRLITNANAPASQDHTRVR